MLTPSTVSVADYTAAVKADAPYHIRITFMNQGIVLTDSDIVAGGFELRSYMNADVDLTVGRAIMDEVNMQIINSSKLDELVWNQEFQLEFGLEVGLVTDWVTIGYYTGKRPEKIRNVDIINFIGYDRMNWFNTSAEQWLKSLTFPMTVSQIYASLCDYVGITSDSGDELPNMLNRTFLQNPIANTGVDCRTILATIAEACGCYAKINADGNVQMKWFSDQQTYELGASDEFSVDPLDLKEGKKWIELEDKTWAEMEQYRWIDLEGYNSALRINSVTVKLTEDDLGVSFPSHSGYNDYLIIDNPFLRTGSTAEVQQYIAPLYARLNGFGGYLPVSVAVVGNALVEAGDVITVDVGGESIRLPIFTKVMQWTGGLTDGYESTGNLEREEFTAEQRQRLSEGGRYHIFKNTIDELYSELYDPTTGDVSIIKQIVNAILLSAAGIDLQAGKYININSQSELDVKSGGTLNIESDGVINVEGGEVNIKSNGILSIASDGALDVQTSNFVLDSENQIIDIDTTNFKISSINKEFIADGWKLNTNGIHAYLGTNLAFDLGVDSTLNPYALRLHLESDFLGNIGEIYFSPGLYGVDIEPPSVDLGYIGLVNRFYSISARIFNYSSLVQNSSKEVKHDIKALPSVGEKLDKLKPVTFIYNNDKDEQTRHGLIYEDTVEVMPEICTNDENNKAINYVELIPMLLKEIQDLRARVKYLEEREEKK